MAAAAEEEEAATKEKEETVDRVDTDLRADVSYIVPSSFFPFGKEEKKGK